MLGGTFNPPTLGHLAIAGHAREQLGLERVVLMPTGSPPHKRIDEDPGPRRRLEMCRLLVRGAEGLAVCALETEREGPSYTVDTLRELHARHPETELTFIGGADVASTLPGWREPLALLELATLAVAERPGSDRSGVLDALARLGAAERVCFLEAPLIDVSSSRARKRAAVGEPIERLVGADVAAYVAEHALYGAGARTAS
ncbi:MAG: nicotinate (nicotinamide) nucleotide adenylyltransferase [Solirubrobacterales bacterium]